MTTAQILDLLSEVEGDTITDDGTAIQYRFDDDGTVTFESTTPNGEYTHRQLRLVEVTS